MRALIAMPLTILVSLLFATSCTPAPNGSEDTSELMDALDTLDDQDPSDATNVCFGATADCDSDAGNGCETNLAYSAMHCGACGNACPSGEVCNDGQCGAECGPDPCTLRAKKATAKSPAKYFALLNTSNS